MSEEGSPPLLFHRCHFITISSHLKLADFISCYFIFTQSSRKGFLSCYLPRKSETLWTPHSNNKSSLHTKRREREEGLHLSRRKPHQNLEHFEFNSTLHSHSQTMDTIRPLPKNKKCAEIDRREKGEKIRRRRFNSKDVENWFALIWFWKRRPMWFRTELNVNKNFIWWCVLCEFGCIREIFRSY